MKKASVSKNYLFNLAYHLISIFAPLIVVPYVSRILGASGMGVFGYTISIVTYFVLFGSLGLSLYGQREIAFVQNDKEKRSKVFFELMIIKCISIPIVGLIFYFVFCRTGEYALYYRILLLELVGNLVDISWLYQGLEDFKKVFVRNIIIKLLYVVCSFVFVKTKDDIGIYLLIYSLSTLLGSLTLFINLNKIIEKPNKIELKKHIKPLLKLFIPQIAIQVYVVLDKTMIGFILKDMSEVGYYEQAQKIIKVVLSLVTAISTVMMPRIAACYAENDKDKIKEYLFKTFNYAFIISIPMVFGILAISSKFVPSFFGEGYWQTVYIMNIMSIIIVFISLSNIIGVQYLLPTKREKGYTTSVVIGAIVNVILNFLLISKFKSYGAAISTVIAELSVTCVQFYFIRKDFNIKDILKLSKNYIFAGFIMFIICFFFNKAEFVRRTFIIILEIIIGTVSYFGILLLMKDKFLLDIYNTKIKKYLRMLKRVK